MCSSIPFDEAGASLPNGHPNQPYDRLPGTWETYHTKWAKPLAGGPLRVLFIVPYSNSREVIELAQRLDIEYTVIMTAGRSVWKHGSFIPESASGDGTPLHGEDADILDQIAAQRLALDNRYDSIVIGKISWEVIPADLRQQILKHVARGTGLVYVSPNRFKEGEGSFDEVDGEDRQYTALFHSDEDPEVGKSITGSLPFDFIPLKVFGALDEFATFNDIPVKDYRAGGAVMVQVPVCITTSHHDRGRVLALNYFDDKLSRAGGDDSLTPRVEYDRVTYDYFHAILARCVRWSAAEVPVVPRIAFRGPSTSLIAAVDNSKMRFSYEAKTPQRVFARKDLAAAAILLSAACDPSAEQELTFEYSIRSTVGAVLASGKIAAEPAPGEVGVVEVPIPMLRRGNYLVDLRILNRAGEILDFASETFRVENPLQVVSISSDRDGYGRQDNISGWVQLSGGLDPGQWLEVRVVDSWDRTVFKAPLHLNPWSQSGKFTIPVANPVSNLWDIYGVICDADGDVDAQKISVGIPQQEYQDYYWGTIFCVAPGENWKGSMYAERGRDFGLRGHFSCLIYDRFHELEAVERANMDNLIFTEHMGQAGNAKAHGGPWDEEFSESCMGELSRMLRYTADTGELPDTEKFPYKNDQGAWTLDADWLSHKMQGYEKASKYGTPFHTLTGENYLSGEMPGVDQPNSCFCPLCTKNFQDWCREEYDNDLNALNVEWGTDFTQWEQIRGILRKDAEENDQRPRWVAFRHFMRAEVWTQLFIDWTDALRRFIPGTKTGRVGHDHFDFSRFRNHMTSSKIYNLQEHNDELQVMVPQELLQSFSGDQSILYGASAMLRWMHDHRTSQRQFRLPWKMLFMGFKGFDWERCLTTNTLGGESPFTPDFSEPMPFFKNISDQVLYLQRGVGKLANTAAPLRSPVAILWSPWNDYISRLSRPGGRGVDGQSSEKFPFSGSWLYNTSYDFGAHHDCLALLKSLRICGTFVAPEDVINGDLEKRGFKALMLPYSKGMSLEEAAAIRKFVDNGGLVIADNTPAIYSRFGRELEESRLADLFPDMSRTGVISVGKGHAAYAHEQICGYLKRMEACDRSGSDEVAALLNQYAGIATAVELIDDGGSPRRDTLMPVYLQGSAIYVGMLRHEESDGKTSAPTTVEFAQKFHVWDVLQKQYLGCVDRANIDLDMYPKFFALLPAKPVEITLTPAPQKVLQGETIRIAGAIGFAAGSAAEISALGQVVHVRVYTSEGNELECFRDNIIFAGAAFEVVLPISYTEAAGIYTLKTEYPVTGMESQVSFEVLLN